MVTAKRLCMPSDTYSEPPHLGLPITLIHPHSLNPSFTSPLTMIQRPMQIPPLPYLTNPTSPPSTLTPAGEFKSETLYLTERNFCSTNFAQCMDTPSPDAETPYPGNPSDKSAST